MKSKTKIWIFSTSWSKMQIKFYIDLIDRSFKITFSIFKQMKSKHSLKIAIVWVPSTHHLSTSKRYFHKFNQWISQLVLLQSKFHQSNQKRLPRMKQYLQWILLFSLYQIKSILKQAKMFHHLKFIINRPMMERRETLIKSIINKHLTRFLICIFLTNIALSFWNFHRSIWNHISKRTSLFLILMRQWFILLMKETLQKWKVK